MRRIALLLILLFPVVTLAQNLVPNWSFEDTVSCPDNLAEVNRAFGWSTYRESPDYFNSCALNNPGGVSIPQNVWGYQAARTGSAYAGFTTYGAASIDFREYLGIQLSQPTQIGLKYYISFYISRAANAFGMQYASNNIGMRFSKMPYSDLNPAPINNLANINETAIISDTINWIKISGSFISDSTYNYAIFGNFFNDSLTQSMQVGPNLGYAFYYIDDIKISTDSGFVNDIPELNYITQLMFTSTDKEWVEFRGNELSTIEIIDMSGKTVLFKKNILLPIKINITNLAKGIYIGKMQFKKRVATYKFIKN